MENVKITFEGGVMNVAISGKIDSTNAPALEAEIQAVWDTPHTAARVIADELQYISSAGLRVLLKMKKRDDDFVITGVSPEIYEILDMTGFTEMLTVEKAYRRLSVEGCEIIGRGANGEVYRIDPETIIKVYLSPDSLPDIKRERELARRAFVLGIPTAIPYDVVKVGNSYGSVFELLNAKSLAKILVEDPGNIGGVVEMYVDLMKKIHSTVVKDSDMPSITDEARTWFGNVSSKLSGERGKKLYAMFEAIPESLHMLHGDYHIKNVMVQDGEALLIDMDTICHGDPVYELAFMYNAYQGHSLFDRTVVENFLGIPYELAAELWDKSVRRYIGTDDDEEIARVKDRAALVGLTRLTNRAFRRAIPTAPRYLKAVEDLVDRVDKLTIN